MHRYGTACAQMTKNEEMGCHARAPGRRCTSQPLFLVLRISLRLFQKDRGDTEPFEMCPLKLRLNSKVILIPRYLPPPPLILTHRRRLIEPRYY